MEKLHCMGIMSDLNHDSDPKIISGLWNSIKFIKESHLARRDWQFRIIAVNIEESNEGKGSAVGGEVWLSLWFVQSVTSGSSQLFEDPICFFEGEAWFRMRLEFLTSSCSLLFTRSCCYKF